MKKFITLLACIIVCLSIVSCSGDQENDDVSDQTSAEGTVDTGSDDVSEEVSVDADSQWEGYFILGYSDCTLIQMIANGDDTYTLVCNGYHYELVVDTAMDSDLKAFYEGYASEDDSYYISISFSYDAYTEVLASFYEGDEYIGMENGCRARFGDNYYGYDENGNRVEDAVTIVVEDEKMQITIWDQYQTDWLDLSGALFSATGEIYFEDMPVNDLTDGNTYHLYVLDQDYYLMNDEGEYESVNEHIYYTITNNDGVRVEDGVAFSLFNYDNTDYLIQKEFYANTVFTCTSTGDTIEFTDDALIVNGEVFANINYDAITETMFIQGDYTIKIDGECMYTFKRYINSYADDMDMTRVVMSISTFEDTSDFIVNANFAKKE